MSKIKLNCNFCEADVFKFPSEIRGENVYCNRKCFKKFHEQNRETRECNQCGKEVTRKKSGFKNKETFCSTTCVSKWQSTIFSGKGNPFYGKKHKPEAVEKNKQWHLKFGLKGKNHPNFAQVKVSCETCGEPTIKTPYLISRSKYDYCSDECRCAGQRKIIAGTKNPNYNPDLTAEDRLRNRTSNLGYVRFKNEVLRRDDYRCAICGNKENLVVHHLNSHHWDRENRVNPENGRVLCNDCHTDFHQLYGYKHNTKEQFKEYIALNDNQPKINGSKQLTLF